MSFGTGNEYVSEGKTYKLLNKISEKRLDTGNYKYQPIVYMYRAECDGQVCTVKVYKNENGEIVFKVI